MVAPLVAASAIGAGAGLLGGFQQNSAAKAAAAKQMKFQERTLKHQYQWGMEDMRKAGLNPMLAYKQGGAGSASGSSYTPQNVGSAAVQGGSTASASAMAQLRQKTELENIRADTGSKNALRHQATNQAFLNAANTARAVTDERLTQQHLHSAKALAAQAKTDERISKSTYGKALRWIDRTKAAVNPFQPIRLQSKN